MTAHRGRLSLTVLLFTVMWACCAHAHVASNGFLVGHVTGEDITGSIELSVRDIELAVGVDANRDGKVTWGELRAADPQVARYVKEHNPFITQKKPWWLAFQASKVNDCVDGSYAWLPFTARCPAAIRELDIR